MVRTYYPFKRRLTPRGRLVWYQYDDEYPEFSFLGAEVMGKLVWSAMIHRKEMKLIKTPESWDQMIEDYPRGNTIAEGLSKKKR